MLAIGLALVNDTRFSERYTNPSICDVIENSVVLSVGGNVMTRSVLRACVGAVALAVLVSFGASPGFTQAPSDIVDKRIKQMKKMKTAMTGMKQLVAEASLDVAKAKGFAGSIASESKSVVGMFPAGTNVPPTEALPEVWSKPDDFKAAAEKAIATADEMLAAVNAGDFAKVKSAYGAMVKLCDGCHDSFLKN